MSNDQYDWFEPTPETLEAIDQTNEAHQQDLAAARRIQDEVGAEGYITICKSIVGFSFSDAPPDGWTKRYRHNGCDYFMPTRRSKAGKALADEIRQVAFLGMERFQNLYGGTQIVGGEDAFRGSCFFILGPVFRKFGDRMLVGLPKRTNQAMFTMPRGRAVPLSEALAAAGE